MVEAGVLPLLAGITDPLIPAGQRDWKREAQAGKEAWLATARLDPPPFKRHETR
jgi:hypothetical protein